MYSHKNSVTAVTGLDCVLNFAHFIQVKYLQSGEIVSCMPPKDKSKKFNSKEIHRKAEAFFYSG